MQQPVAMVNSATALALLALIGCGGAAARAQTSRVVEAPVVEGPVAEASVAEVPVVEAQVVEAPAVSLPRPEDLPYPDRRASGSSTEIAVAIERGSSFGAIAASLHERGVIEDAEQFQQYAAERGAMGTARAGRYRMRGNLTPREVLDSLLTGGTDPLTMVVLPEGEHMLEMFGRLEVAGVARAADLERLARDRVFLDAHGISGETAEGYLFPDTYDFALPTDPARVLDRLIGMHRTVWAKLLEPPANRDRYDALRTRMRWEDRDILTMASIVEKEAVVATEQPRIAQVFLNRLTDNTFRPHRLETDPATRYGCQVPLPRSPGCHDWTPADPLLDAQLHDRTNRYNTYRHEGLPPGPISNPGLGAIAAVLAPDGSGYLYFVAKDDHTHAFACTLAEHNRNKRERQGQADPDRARALGQGPDPSCGRRSGH